MQLILQAIALSLVVKAVLGLLICPNPKVDKLYGTNCYEFVELPWSKPLTYENAVAYCQTRNKTLAVVPSQTEQQSLAKRFSDLMWTRAMIGLHFDKSGWRWADRQSTIVRGQGCQDDSEIDTSLQSTQTSPSMTVDLCVSFCRGSGQRYAAVHAGSVCYCSYDFVWDKPASQCYIPCPGLPGQLCGSYTNSYVYYTAASAYDNWKGGNPGNTGNCATINIDGQKNEWLDTDCSLTRPFLCQFVNTTNVTANNFAQKKCDTKGVCYYLFTSPKLSWADADNFCIRNGGHLATINSDDRQNIASGIAAGSSDVTQFWIGANSYNWHFSDGSIPSFSGWISKDQPTLPEFRSCVEAISANGTFGWKSRSCESLDDGYPNRLVCSALAIEIPGARRRPITGGNGGGSGSGDGNGSIAGDGSGSGVGPDYYELGPDDVPTTSKPGQNSANSSSGTSGQSTNSVSNANATGTGKTPQSGSTTVSSQKQTASTNESTTSAMLAPGDAGAVKAESSKGDGESTAIRWWSILLIVLAVIILVAALIAVTIYLVKNRSPNGGKQRVASEVKRQVKQEPRKREATKIDMSDAFRAGAGNSQTMLF